MPGPSPQSTTGTRGSPCSPSTRTGPSARLRGPRRCPARSTWTLTTPTALSTGRTANGGRTRIAPSPSPTRGRRGSLCATSEGTASHTTRGGRAGRSSGGARWRSRLGWGRGTASSTQGCARVMSSTSSRAASPCSASTASGPGGRRGPRSPGGSSSTCRQSARCLQSGRTSKLRRTGCGRPPRTAARSAFTPPAASSLSATAGTTRSPSSGCWRGRGACSSCRRSRPRGGPAPATTTSRPTAAGSSPATRTATRWPSSPATRPRGSSSCGTRWRARRQTLSTLCPPRAQHLPPTTRPDRPHVEGPREGPGAPWQQRRCTPPRGWRGGGVAGRGRGGACPGPARPDRCGRGIFVHSGRPHGRPAPRPGSPCLACFLFRRLFAMFLFLVVLCFFFFSQPSRG
mmetsp:Transcript_23480/g.59352  ORF Transcript_23480/g.59352 Transcript_23480/m.59352 type:complete len:401 (+) Transcript_23480:437-1639(+)